MASYADSKIVGADAAHTMVEMGLKARGFELLAKQNDRAYWRDRFGRNVIVDNSRGWPRVTWITDAVDVARRGGPVHI